MTVPSDTKAKGTQADRAGNPSEKKEQAVGFGLIPFGSMGQPEQGVRDLSISSGSLISGHGDDWLASPHNYDVAYATVERSWPLQAVTAAFIANVYSSQVAIKIKVDPATKEGKKQIRRWLLFKRKGRRPAERDLTKAYQEIEDKLEYEHAVLEAWMANAGLEEPLPVVKALVGMDTIAGAAGYMELLRDSNGVPQKVLFCPGRFVRARPQSGLVSFKNNVWDNPLSHRLERTYQRFRSYGLIPPDFVDNPVVYFRHVGDPRVLSRGTGQFYKSHADLKANLRERYNLDQVEYTYLPATELIPFVRRTSWSEDYGSLPWSGGYVNAIGLRECEEVDRRLLNGSRLLPLLLITIAGGQGLTGAQQKKWAAEWRKAREQGEFSVAFFQALADQGAMGGSECQPKMTITNTRQALVEEGLGIGYMQGAVRGILGSFRYPRVAIGQDEGINHATAKYLMRMVESQVHDPEREWFYGILNNAILPGLGLSLVEMQSIPRRTKDLEELSTVVKNLQDVSKPEELRSMLRDALGGVYGDVDDKWVDVPLRVLMAMAQNKDSTPTEQLGSTGDEQDGADTATRTDAGDDSTAQDTGAYPPGFGR